MKVLVMGGAGFIGQNICAQLENEKIEYDIYSNKAIDKDNIIIGDILNDVQFQDFIKNYDSVIYLISFGFSQEFFEKPGETYDKEITALTKTLDCCVKQGVKRIIFASSGGTVYGEGNGHKQKESDDTNPINHYGICKLTCEKILLLYNYLYGMENISLRISNPYGIGQSPKSGVGLITAVTYRMINDQNIVVFGDGTAVRDYIDIESVAKAFHKALCWEFDKSIVPIFNIGSGQELSINDILGLVQETLNIKANITYMSKRAFDVEYSCLDVTKTGQAFDLSVGDQNDKIRNYVLDIKKSGGKI